jgi:hypothetical protein
MSTLPFVSGIDNAQFGGQASPWNRSHEWRLARMLEIGANPESAESKQKTEQMIGLERVALEQHISTLPRYLSELSVADFKQRRELLLSEAIESTTLIQSEFYNAVLEGAEPNKVMRNALRVIPMKSNQQTFTLGETGSVLPVVAEGAELDTNNQNYTTCTLTSKKYGEKGMITNELIEDAMYDIVALEVAKSGARAENTLNHVALTMLLDDAGLEHDTAEGVTTGYGFPAIAAARKAMKQANYNPDICILCAESEYKLLIDSQLSYSAYYGGAGVTPAVARGVVPPMLGMKFTPSLDPADTTYDSGTYTWDYGANGEIGMVLVDSASLAGLIGLRRDITVRDYDDPIRDLKGAALTIRFAVGSPFDNGICRVEY